MHCSLLFCFSSCCYSSTKTITITILEIDLISTGVTETLSKTTAWRHRKKSLKKSRGLLPRHKGYQPPKRSGWPTHAGNVSSRCPKKMATLSILAKPTAPTNLAKFRERNGSPKRPRSGRRRKLPPVKQEYNSLHEM